jgi:hypothetical protein
VTIYLLPDVNRRLAPKLAALKAGTRIVSHDYGLGDWPPDRTIVVDAPDKPVNVDKRSTLHFWRVPARIEGRWLGDAGGEPIVLEFRQRYQHVSGALHWAAREYRFADARVDGERLAFALNRQNGAELAVDLRASGNRIVGELRVAGERSLPVEARR